MSLRILIVDDNSVIRRLLRSFIEQYSDWQVCGEAEDGKIAIEKVAELKPNMMILDLSMPVMNGLEAARQIAQIAPKVAMVLFTMHSSEQLQKDARAIGIKDVVLKTDKLEDHLLASLKTVSVGL